MAYDLEEQEQIEQLKAWWSKYGTLTLLLLSLALAVVLGWQGWNWYQNHQATQARGYFEALQKASTQMDSPESVNRVQAAMTTLQSDFPATDYAARAALVAGDALARDGNNAGAEAALAWLARSEHEAFAPIARLRLAGLLMDQKKFDDALALLDEPPPSFEGVFADRRGDVLLAKGDVKAAKAQWGRALELLGAANPLISIVQLKIETSGA
ncbi:YfgM family protein [Orrella marina]|uniref:Ancillary SecYEG translocon subunit n=1 Tax=Orrella marina TaxID=2163011 RepID=A0A2R4XI50_9BURK|nr:tetratricopeptide repeat protein [Orrella marina]AWB33502.1 hypothetical protein DBV39_07035 [Orrella marina]